MPVGDRTDQGEGSPTEAQGVRAKGRTRYCRKCSFTCTDAKEFSVHQTLHSLSDASEQDHTFKELKKPTATSSSSEGPEKKISSTTSQRVLRSRSHPRPDLSDVSSKVETELEHSESKASDIPSEMAHLVNGNAHEDEEMENQMENENNAMVVKKKQEVKEEHEDDMEENQDEPDAMTATPAKEKFCRVVEEEDEEKTKMQNGYLSVDEDIEDEGKLVIDDNNKDNHNNHGIPTGTYGCSDCPMELNSPKKYLFHRREKHNDPTPIFECNFCEFVSVREVDMTEHKNRFHSKKPSIEISLLEQHRLRQSPSGLAGPSGLNLSASFDASFLGRNSSTPLGHDHRSLDEDDVDMVSAPRTSTMPLTITHENIDQMLDEDRKKKKKTRQEVDPGKYFEAVDSSGTKYACSQCGNIYKWRKSLNKHWKEKHLKDPLVEEPCPPGMVELLKSGKYTQLGARRIYDNVFLSTIKTSKDDEPARPPSSTGSNARSPSPPNFLNTPSTTAMAMSHLAASMASAMMPKIIGPFVASNTQPVFPGMPMGLPHLPMQNGFMPVGDNALDLTRDQRVESRDSPYSNMSGQDYNTPSTSYAQDQPLDFSKKSDRDSPATKSEKPWDSTAMLPGTSSGNHKVHRCTKCDFTTTSEVDFANHTSSHLNKRVVRCYECKLQLNSMDELNTHFNRAHSKKLSDYKEAIKKIPHGLQQTYHLLKMDLTAIGELGNQDPGSSDVKNLKCKKCDFEAKWPAELQKHAVSHSEERPYICMVCGSTYKWKWDLVKHFQKSHPNLPNPYRRNDKRETPEGSSEDEGDDEPEAKKARMSAGMVAGPSHGASPMMGASSLNGVMYNREDPISVEGIIAATQAGQRLVSSQPNLLDDEPSLERNMAFLNALPFMASQEAARQAIERQTRENARRAAIQEAAQAAMRNQQNGGPSASNGSGSNKRPGTASSSTSPSASSTKAEDLPYKCTMCNYHARWPSEVTQHMKNHSDKKPYLCPRCDYRSKWKWDVVKHLKRCGGGGGIEDVIDTTKGSKKDGSNNNNGPPNAVVSQQGKVKKMTPQPPVTYIMPSMDENGDPSAVVVRSLPGARSSFPQGSSAMQDHSENSTASSTSGELNTSMNNNNDSSTLDNNVNNNYVMYSNGQATPTLGAAATASSSSLLHSSSESPRSSPGPQPSTSRNSSGEVFNCLHCPFSTQSQAELKRHSGLHSDDKPFKCDVCHYSTRWACDLKKHRRSYNHYPQNKNNDTPQPPKENGMMSGMGGGDPEKSDKGRFKCAQCSIFFQSLLALLEHRKAEHFGKDSNQGSPKPPIEHNEIDQARIKHPRKPMKQIACHKCPFVCKNRQTMDKHLEEHELLEQSPFKCSFCPLQFKDKESLLDHVSTHSAFNPKEWETFFMINDDDEFPREEMNGDSSGHFLNSEPRDMASPLHLNIPTPSKETTEKTSKSDNEENDPEARIRHILETIPKQSKSSDMGSPPMQSPSNTYKCEWCPAKFPTLTAAYKHASQAHPVQLREQDMTHSVSVKPDVPPTQPKKAYTGEPIEILRQQIEEKRNQQLAEKFTEMYSTNPKLQEMMNKKMEEERAGAKSYRCDKCSFSTPSPLTFQRHYELHGSRLPSQCWFCDYSVERMDLLYQHMKISHTRKWKSLAQDPKYAGQIQKLQAAFANAGFPTSNNNDSPPDSMASPGSDSGAMDLTAKKKSLTPTDDLTHDVMYITKQQYTWSGIPVNVIPVGSALNFVCPHCSFNDASIAKTCAHVMQSHRAMSKFTCKRCSFSDDNIHVMSDHCKTNHPRNERVVEVLDFKQLNFSELQMVQLSAMKERKSQEMSSPGAKPFLSCPFCPFKTTVTDSMKSHVSNHSRKARFRCQLCDFSSDLTNIITDHVEVHEPTYTGETAPTSEQAPFPINFSKSSDEESAFKIKEENPSTDSKPMKRETPDVPSLNLCNNIETSPKAEGSPRTKSSGRLRYRCSACPYHTTCKSNILKHKRQHLHNKRYKCPKCSYSAARAVLLKNHLEAHDVPIEDDGSHHDVFCNPNSPSDDLRSDSNEENETEEADNEAEDGEDGDTTSDDMESEMDAKAIADLEEKYLMEAEAAHKNAEIASEDDVSNSEDKQQRKQKCPDCPFSSNSSTEFRKHMNFHGTQERYKCDYCTYSLDRINLLSQHRKLHSDEPGFNPDPSASELLNTCFILQQNAQESEQKTTEKEQGESSNAKVQFSCMQCPFKTQSKSTLDVHLASHGQRKRYICDFCDWSTDLMATLQQHRQVHESDPDFNASPEESTFINEEFDDGGASGEFEAKLMEIKNSEKPVKEGESESQLSPPVKLTVVKKSYPCRLCPFKTNSKSSYSVHKSMHGSGAKFACTECSYAVISRGLLQQHIQLHSSSPQLSPTDDGTKMNDFSKDMTTPCKESPETKSEQAEGKSASGPELTCQRCPFTCGSQSALQEHLKGHNVQDKLQCPYCDFSATSKTIMFPHIQIHFPGSELSTAAMEKMLEEQAQSNNNSANSGVKDNSSSAPKRIYVCRYCDREFEAKATMIQHEKQHLPGTH